MLDTLFILFQRVLPKHALSALIGTLCRLRGGALSRLGVRLFVRAFAVDLSDAEHSDPAVYSTFNDFFTRALKADARPQARSSDAVSCAADGRISEQGNISGDSLVQAKGVNYSLTALFDGDKEMASRFDNGVFQTVYLAPYNYHRVHMPLDGVAAELRYIPGALFAVNARTAARLSGLFCRNERVAVSFTTEGGWFALIMVGALNVGSIELTVPREAGFTNRPVNNLKPDRRYTLDGPTLQRGDEFGRFNMGSTVIMLASPGLVQWGEDIAAGSVVRVGQTIGQRLG